MSDTNEPNKHNEFSISYIPRLKTNEGLGIKSIDIANTILNDIEMLDDNEFEVAAHVRLAKIAKAIGVVFKNESYKETVMEAQQKLAGKNNAKKVDIEGATLSYMATKTTYDYSNCGHPVFEFLNSVDAKFKDIKKNLEKEVKLIPQSDIDYKPDPITGEAIAFKVGGSKKVYIDPEVLVETFTFVITEAEHMINLVNDAKGMFLIKAPKITKSMGIKVDNA